MTGWNLPPGCETWHIPGNRPDDLLWERESEKFCEDCPKQNCDKTVSDCERSTEFEKLFEAVLDGTAYDAVRYEEMRDREL